jgi:hypothetical protein
MAPPDSFTTSTIRSVHIGSAIVDSYCCMHDDVRKIFVVRVIDLEHDSFTESITKSGFFCVDDTMWFVSETPLDSVIPIESAFVCLGIELPSKIFKDDFPDQPALDAVTVGESPMIRSTPSMLTSWRFRDTLPLRRDDLPLEADYHVDVERAAKSMGKYLKRPPTGDVPLPAVLPVFSQTRNPVPAPAPRKKTKDAREFREQILSNGAQAEFFIWNHIKAAYGDSADLSWWLTSTKRQFFPTDLTPLDDAAGADFRIPNDTKCLFASRQGGPVQIEVKGTGRLVNDPDSVSFEISRNELKVAGEAKEKGEEYVVAVVSGLAGFGRPQLETVIRDLSQLELVPTRFLATIKVAVTATTGPTPSLTKSSWY